MSSNIVYGKTFYKSLSYKGELISSTKRLTDGAKITGSDVVIITPTQCLYIVFDELFDIDKYSLRVDLGASNYAIDFYDENDKIIRTINSPNYTTTTSVGSVIEKVKGVSIRNTRSANNEIRELEIYGTIHVKRIVNKALILHEGEYKKYNKEIEGTYTKLIEKMTGYTSTLGRVSAGNEYQTRYAWRAFDTYYSNFSESWQFTYPSWLRFDFNERQTISAYSVRCISLETNYMSKSWTFQITQDGSTWETVDTRSNLSWTTGQERMFYLTKSYNCIGFRINVTNSTYGSYGRIGEMNVYSFTEGEPGNWETVSSTLPTEEQFLSEGMDSLSPLFDRRLVNLDPEPMVDITSDVLEDMESGRGLKASVDLRRLPNIRTLEIKDK